MSHRSSRPTAFLVAAACACFFACARQVGSTPPPPPRPALPDGGTPAASAAPDDAAPEEVTAFTNLPFFPVLSMDAGCELTASRVTCFSLEADSESMRVSARLPVTGLPPAVELRVGSTFACARTVAKTVYCWSLEPDPEHGLAATQVAHLEDVRSLGMFRSRACAVTERGEVACFDPAAPTHDAQLVDAGKTGRLAGIITVESGSSHACAIDERARVWCWGDNNLGQLGTGYGPGSALAREVPGLGRTKSFAVDFDYTCAAAEGGALRCWGRMTAPPVYPANDATSYRPYRVRGGVRRVQRWTFIGGSGAGEGPALWTDAGFFDGWDKKNLGARVTDVSASQVALCARFENGDVRCPSELHGGPSIGDGLSIPPAPQRLPPFSFAAFTRVQGLAFAATSTCERPFEDAPGELPSPRAAVDDRKACASLEQPGRALDARQRERLLAITADRASFGSSQEGWPHEATPDHAFVFYDADDQPVAWIAVDLHCQSAWAYPPVPAAIATGASWGERTPLEPRAARQFAELCTALGLSRCPKPSSIPNRPPCASSH